MERIEDKLIGPFFLNNDDLTDENFDSRFKSKLLMYLYQDVLRHKSKDFFKSDTVDTSTFSKLLKSYESNGMDIFNFELTYTEPGVDPKETVKNSEN